MGPALAQSLSEAGAGQELQHRKDQDGSRPGTQVGLIWGQSQSCGETQTERCCMVGCRPVFIIYFKDFINLIITQLHFFPGNMDGVTEFGNNHLKNTKFWDKTCAILIKKFYSILLNYSHIINNNTTLQLVNKLFRGLKVSLGVCLSRYCFIC